MIDTRKVVKTENLIRSVRLEMGQDRGGGVDVELTDGMIIHSLRAALAAYSKYHPRRSYQHFECGQGSTELTLDPPAQEIINLSIVPQNSRTRIIPGYPEIINYGGSILNIGPHSTYDAAYTFQVFQVWKEATEKAFSRTIAWYFIPEFSKLYVHSPAYAVNVTVEAGIEFDSAFDEELMWDKPALPDNTDESKKTDTSRLDKTLQEISSKHLNWVRELTLARSMIVLGRMRSKFGAIPGADGKDIQLDGAARIEEAEKMIERITEEMRFAALGDYTPIVE